MAQHTNNYWIKKIKSLYTNTDWYSFREYCTPHERGVYIQNDKTWERIREATSREALYLKMKWQCHK